MKKLGISSLVDRIPSDLSLYTVSVYLHLCVHARRLNIAFVVGFVVE